MIVESITSVNSIKLDTNLSPPSFPWWNGLDFKHAPSTIYSSDSCSSLILQSPSNNQSHKDKDEIVLSPNNTPIFGCHMPSMTSSNSLSWEFFDSCLQTISNNVSANPILSSSSSSLVTSDCHIGPSSFDDIDSMDLVEGKIAKQLEYLTVLQSQEAQKKEIKSSIKSSSDIVEKGTTFVRRLSSKERIRNLIAKFQSNDYFNNTAKGTAAASLSSQLPTKKEGKAVPITVKVGRKSSSGAKEKKKEYYETTGASLSDKNSSLMMMTNQDDAIDDETKLSLERSRKFKTWITSQLKKTPQKGILKEPKPISMSPRLSSVMFLNDDSETSSNCSSVTSQPDVHMEDPFLIGEDPIEFDDIIVSSTLGSSHLYPSISRFRYHGSEIYTRGRIRIRSRSPERVSFNQMVLVGEAISGEDYERKGDYIAKCLTPEIAFLIKRELNEIKQEMQVHEAKSGISVVAFDIRGFGRTIALDDSVKSVYTYNGHPAFLESLDRIYEDIEEMTDFTKTLYSQNLPFILMGHSMGGQIALSFMTRKLNRFKDLFVGLIASSPLILLEMKIPWWKYYGTKMMVHVSKKTLVANDVIVENLSRDPKVGEAYKTDHLIQWKVAMGTADEILTTADKLNKDKYKEIKEINIPILISHGTDDRLTSFKASKAYFERFQLSNPNPLHKMLIYEGGYHELHNDIIKDQVIADYLSWIRSVIQQ